MVTFDPRDWLGPSGRFGRGTGAGRRSRDLNRETAGRWAAAMAFCLCFASLAPAPLFPFALSGLLFLASCASIGVALVQRTPPLAPHLTAWDEAAWSLAASLALQLWLGPPPAV